MKVETSGFLPGNDGVCAVLIYRKKVLLIKRHWLPIIRNPNIWSFVFGTREKGDSHESTVYREIEEETGIKKEQLKLVSKPIVTKLFDTKSPSKWWYNHFYVFKSTSSKVRLDLENTGYRWAKFAEIKESKDYTNIFVDKERINRLIERALDER